MSIYIIAFPFQLISETKEMEPTTSRGDRGKVVWLQETFTLFLIFSLLPALLYFLQRCLGPYWE
jgi:hypothetical protein